MKYIILLILISGCSPLSDTTEKVSATAKAAADMQADIVEAGQVVGDGNTFQGNVTITGIPETKKTIISNFKTDIESSYSMETKISFALACFFFALSLGFGAVGLWLLIQVLGKSKAIKATSLLVDNAMASAVAMASNSTDPKEISSAHHLKAELAQFNKYL